VKILRFALPVLIAILILGCASSSPPKYCARTPFGLLAVSPVQTVAPSPGKALVVFYTPDLTDYCPESGSADRAFPPSVYHLNGDTQELLGFVDMGGKVAYQAPPGRQMFMVNGVENVDFLEAHLDPGKTYFVYISSFKIGVNSRYVLNPVRRDPSAPSYQLHGHKLNLQEEWVTYRIEQSKYVEKTQRALQWYESNKAKLDDKRHTTLPRWMDAASQGKKGLQTLNADDGI
jgi:hypothetical protein